MKLSKRQKVFVAILGLAVAGLIADRAFLGTDASGPSEAAAVPSPYSPDPPMPIRRALAAAPSAGARSLAERLEALSPTHEADLANIHDAFSLPAAWKAQLSAQNKTARTVTAAEAFVRKHELTAVVISGRAPVAVVDDRCVSVGQVVDDFKLILVNENSATFESRGRRAVLKLKGDMNGP